MTTAASASSVPLSRLHVPALDGIRGLAILLVIPHNAGLLLDLPGPMHGAAYLTRELMQFGWAGVQLFFVLSGFLITGGLLDARGAQGYYSSFYLRRALRILPLYVAVLSVTFLLLTPLRLLPHGLLASAHHQIWLWTFLSNWTDPIGWGVSGFTHFWSLAVEEQFYLLWPLVVLRLEPRRLPALALIVSVASLGIRTAMRYAGSPPDYVYEFTVCRMDALALGAAAAAMLRLPDQQARLRRWSAYLPWVALATTGALAPLTRGYTVSGFATQTVGMSALAVAFTALVLHAAVDQRASPGWVNRVLSFGALRSVGKYSYAMYVFHYPLHTLLGVGLIARITPRPDWRVALLYVACLTLACYASALASWYLLESRFLRLRRYAAAS